MSIEIFQISKSIASKGLQLNDDLLQKYMTVITSDIVNEQTNLFIEYL